MPDDAADISVRRIVVRGGFNRDLASMLLEHIGKAVEQLTATPPARSASSAPQFVR